MDWARLVCCLSAALLIVLSTTLFSAWLEGKGESCNDAIWWALGCALYAATMLYIAMD